jgi:hypothetical protein
MYWELGRAHDVQSTKGNKAGQNLSTFIYILGKEKENEHGEQLK